jgi:hypothetical protein
LVCIAFNRGKSNLLTLLPYKYSVFDFFLTQKLTSKVKKSEKSHQPWIGTPLGGVAPRMRSFSILWVALSSSDFARVSFSPKHNPLLQNTRSL